MGHDSKEMYYLESGQLEAFSYGEDERISLGFIDPGELVGESSLILGAARSATVEAVVESEVLAIDPEAYQKVQQSQHPWIAALIKTLIKRIQKLNKRLLGMGP